MYATAVVGRFDCDYNQRQCGGARDETVRLSLDRLEIRARITLLCFETGARSCQQTDVGCKQHHPQPYARLLGARNKDISVSAPADSSRSLVSTQSPRPRIADEADYLTWQSTSSFPLFIIQSETGHVMSEVNFFPSTIVHFFWLARV